MMGVPVPIIRCVNSGDEGFAFVAYKIPGSVFLRWKAYRMVDGDPTRLEVAE